MQILLVADVIRVFFLLWKYLEREKRNITNTIKQLQNGYPWSVP